MQRTALVVHGYDVGIRNLAVCAMRVEADASNPRGATCRVLRWEILDCVRAAGAGDVDLGRMRQDAAVSLCATAWPLLSGSMVSEWPDEVYIEQQPGRLNSKMQVVSHCLQLFLHLEFGRRSDGRALPRIEFVEPDLKLQEADFSEYYASPGKKTRDKKYTLNKKHAREFVPRLLRESGESRYADWFEGQGGKRDDLADACLMAYYRARDVLLGRRPPPKAKRVGPRKNAVARARRATASQEARRHPELFAPADSAPADSAPADSDPAAPADSDPAAPRRRPRKRGLAAAVGSPRAPKAARMTPVSTSPTA